MPVNPGNGEAFSAQVADRLRTLEVDLLRTLADLLRKDAPTDQAWVAERLAELQRFRRAITGLTVEAQRELEGLIVDVVHRSYNTGAAMAVGDLVDAGFDIRPTGMRTTTAVDALAGEVNARMVRATAMLPGIFSAAYTDAVAAGASSVLSGQQTRLEASQSVIDRLFKNGVRGFTDSAGRRWSLPSYVEMAVRTATGRAAVDGHVAQLAQSGISLVTVSDAPRECPLCRPWEGKVLSTGPGASRQEIVRVRSVTSGEMVDVDVAGSLAEARSQGFQHPNCRHNVSAYLPGASTPVDATPEPQGYEDQQRQRQIELTLRKWKLEQAKAITPEAAALAKAKTREWSRRLERHLDDHKALKRQRHREGVVSRRPVAN